MTRTQKAFYLSALALAALFLAACFVGVVYYSDERGLVFQLSLNIGTKNGLFSTLADVVFSLAPIFALIALFFLPAVGGRGQKIGLCLHAVPMGLYALMELILFLTVKEGHFSLTVTYLCVILLCAAVCAAAFFPELRIVAAAGTGLWVLLETGLAVLSLVFGEKLSTFVFSQLLPFNKTSTLRVSYFVISMFLFFAAWALSLLCHLFALGHKTDEKCDKSEE